MTKPNKYDEINKLSRADQRIIFQLRTGHGVLNSHLNRINPTHPPLCRNCIHPYETPKHVLLECPKLAGVRRELLPPLPTIHNTLYTDKHQLINTCKFLRLAMGAKEWKTRSTWVRRRIICLFVVLFVCLCVCLFVFSLTVFYLLVCLLVCLVILLYICLL